MAHYFINVCVFLTWGVANVSLANPEVGPSDVSNPPNIILINADDLGYKDAGFMGSRYYETPHLDRLASEGMVFLHAYAGAANCAPSRACLMSGLNTPRHGIYTVASSERGEARTRRIIPTPNTETLADSVYTLAEMLRDNGYITGTFGKWHLNDDPTTQGFLVNAGGSHRGNPGTDGYFSPYNIEFLPDGPPGEYLTDRLTEEAITFVQQYQDTSFFLYLPYYSVHTPIMGKENWVEKFAAKPGTDGQHRADYAAMIASVDENVGRLLAEVEAQGLTRRTIVLFTSDNGGVRAISSQQPLRAGKGSYYEGGIRVPLVVRWPGTIEAGSRSEVPVTNLDIYPTLQSIVQAKKTATMLDGDDISPLFYGQPMPKRSHYWHFPIYLQAYRVGEDEGRDPLFRTRPGSVVRQGAWKLHEYFEDGGLELYNLETDPGETNNLATAEPQRTRALHQQLIDWREDMQAPVPSTPNPEYSAIFEQQQARQKNSQ